MKKKVNLYIIGAMKSGSTTLHNYLHLHSDIYMSNEKEPYYHSCRRWADYEDIFSGSSDEVYLGESSTIYTKLPYHKEVVPNIKAYNPDSKFIYIIRDPFCRAESHYRHKLALGLENLSLDETFASKPKYWEYSDYAMQLAPYYEAFGKEKVFVVIMDDLIREPQESMTKIFQWLDLPNCDIDVSFHSNKSEEIVLDSSNIEWIRFIRVKMQQFGIKQKPVPIWLKKLFIRLGVARVRFNKNEDQYLEDKKLLRNKYLEQRIGIIDQFESLTGVLLPDSWRI